MREITRQSLRELNRRFYQRHAASFDASRQKPWRGWERIAKRHIHENHAPLQVLDLGCGNGRLIEFLARNTARRIVYLGIDTGFQLLTAAHGRLASLANRGVSGTLVEADTTLPLLNHHLGARRFGLITLFGLMHHIPDSRDRALLISRAASLVAPGGILAVSLWQFPLSGKKILDWEEYTDKSELCIDLNDLESGDYLLTWAGDRENPRYCHFINSLEADRLAIAAGLPKIDQFMADGRDDLGNLYLIFRRP